DRGGPAAELQRTARRGALRSAPLEGVVDQALAGLPLRGLPVEVGGPAAPVSELPQARELFHPVRGELVGSLRHGAPALAGCPSIDASSSGNSVRSPTTRTRGSFGKSSRR